MFLQKETEGTKVLADGQTFRSGTTSLSSLASVKFQSAFICAHPRFKPFSTEDNQGNKNLADI